MTNDNWVDKDGYQYRWRVETTRWAILTTPVKANFKGYLILVEDMDDSQRGGE